MASHGLLQPVPFSLPLCCPLLRCAHASACRPPAVALAMHLLLLCSSGGGGGAAADALCESLLISNPPADNATWPVPHRLPGASQKEHAQCRTGHHP